MKSLGSSYLKSFSCQQRDKESVVWCSREFAPSKQEIGFLGLQERVTVGLPLAVSSKNKRIHPIPAASSSAQTNLESEEIQTVTSDQPKTVRIRFKLQKECVFGQRFVVVGDDPILGLWDPSEGVPLNWSEGHVWTAELDIPTEKLIKYKFILKEDSRIISWQPGKDRILETWDTEKTITVSEDWDNPELQSVVEEELVVNEEISGSSEFSLVADNLKEPVVNERTDSVVEETVSSEFSLVAENLNEPLVNEGTDVIKEVADANGYADHEDKLSSVYAPLVAENISVESGEQDSTLSDKGSDLVDVTEQKKAEKVVESLNDEKGKVLDEGVPVLVPGLMPMLKDDIDEAEEINAFEKQDVESVTVELNQVEKHEAESKLIGSDEVEELTKPELKEEHNVSASLHCTETRETKIDKEQQTYDKEQAQNNNVFESDMQWGRRTLQRFLANFGFQ